MVNIGRAFLVGVILLLGAGAYGQDTQPAGGLSYEAKRGADEFIQVGILVLEGVYNSELAAPYDIFQHTVFHTKPEPGMKVFTVGRVEGMITTFEGLKVGVDDMLEDSPRIDGRGVPSAGHKVE